MTDLPTDQLTAYHELHERWVEKFGADRAWWPEWLHKGMYVDGVWVDEPGKWFYGNPYSSAMGEIMHPDDALRLVESYARPALVERGWIRVFGEDHEMVWCHITQHDPKYKTLLDALTAEIERKKE